MTNLKNLFLVSVLGLAFTFSCTTIEKNQHREIASNSNHCESSEMSCRIQVNRFEFTNRQGMTQSNPYSSKSIFNIDGTFSAETKSAIEYFCKPMLSTTLTRIYIQFENYRGTADIISGNEIRDRLMITNAEAFVTNLRGGEELKDIEIRLSPSPMTFHPVNFIQFCGR